MMRSLLGASVGWLGVSMVADGVPTLLLPYRLGGAEAGDATFLGLATLAAIAVAALIQPLAGRLSDRIGRPVVMAAGVAVAGAGLSVLVTASGTALMFFGLMLALCGASIAQAGQQALLPDHVELRRRGAASGLKGVFDVGGALLAFVLLAALLGSGQPELAAVTMFAVLAVSVSAGVVLLRRSRIASGGTQADDSAGSSLAQIVVARFLVLLGIYAVGRFLFLFVADAWALSPEDAAAQAGTALLVLAALTVAASIPAGWLADRVGRRPLMVTGAALSAVGIAIVPFTREPAALIAAGSLLALGSAAFGSASWAALTDAVAPQRSGWHMGLAHLGTAGAAAAAGLFGVVIDAGNRLGPQSGYVAAFVLAACAVLAGGALASRLGSVRGTTVISPPTSPSSVTAEAR